MFEKLKDIILEYVDVDPEKITADANLRSDFNLNSLDIINLAVAIEDELGVSVSDRKMASFYTLGEVADYLESSAAKKQA
ncbi:MAG: acyl carrier protein [Clostridia bacterium]|nr:acyl carrier protein [Clostridia bacterium]